MLNNSNYKVLLLEKATNTNLVDWKKVTKQKRVQPSDGQDLVDAIKHFCNLIQAYSSMSIEATSSVSD